MINHVDELRKTFIHIMTHGCKNNTYKFALARFLLDYCNMMPTSRLSTMSKNNEKIIIHYEEIADAFLRYYWHQEFRYRIKQNFYNERPPSVVKIYVIHLVIDTSQKVFLNMLNMKIKNEKNNLKTSLVVFKCKNWCMVSICNIISRCKIIKTVILEWSKFLNLGIIFILF